MNRFRILFIAASMLTALFAPPIAQAQVYPAYRVPNPTPAPYPDQPASVPPPPSYTPPPPPEAEPVFFLSRPHRRSPWYADLGVGSGIGGFTQEGQSISFPHYLDGYDPETWSLQLGVGATVRPDLLVGFDIHILQTEGSWYGYDASARIADYLAMVTWFPNREGLFLRGGAGLATIRFDEDYYQWQQTTTGLGLLAGVGYAFWLGSNFNLTLGADFSSQSFGYSDNHPSSSRFLDLYVGFGWY